MGIATNMIQATQVKKINFTGPTTMIGGLESIPGEIRALHPGGVNYILIGLSDAPRMASAQSAPGIIAVLIGLLLPAVQKITDGTSNTLLFGEVLRPGGKVWVAMCDGSVRNLYNPKEVGIDLLRRLS